MLTTHSCSSSQRKENVSFHLHLFPILKLKFTNNLVGHRMKSLLGSSWHYCSTRFNVITIFNCLLSVLCRIQRKTVHLSIYILETFALSTWTCSWKQLALRAISWVLKVQQEPWNSFSTWKRLKKHCKVCVAHAAYIAA